MTRFPSDIRLSSAPSAHVSVGTGARAHGFAMPARMTPNPLALAWRTAP